MEKITILIVDDQKLVREAWSFFLNSDPRFNVIGATASPKEAVELVRKNRPSIILLDINMSPFSSLEATKAILGIAPHARIIGISTHSHSSYAMKMMKNGAKGYITKNSSKKEMIKAILEVNLGRTFICEEVRNNIRDKNLDENSSDARISSLTERQIQIIDLIREGYSSPEIAEHLKISVGTVHSHRYNVLKKLNLKNSASLVNFILDNSKFQMR